MTQKPEIGEYLTSKVKMLLLFLFFSHSAYSQEYNFRTFSSADGLPQSYVYTIVQDEQGYLWVGTGDGLSRYNGFFFKSYTTRDSLADNFVNCSIPDGTNIWFGHRNGRISLYNGKRFIKVIYPDRSLSPITHFAKRPDGGIWGSTFSDGLFKLIKGKMVFLNNIPKDQPFINSFEFLNENELLLGTNSGLIYCKPGETGETVIIRPVANFPDVKVTGIQQSGKDPVYYIATENDGLYRLKFNNNGFIISKIETDPGFDFTGIHCIYEDTRMNIWAGSFGNGLIKLVPQSTGKYKLTIYNRTGGFSTDNVITVFEDREGNVWSGNFNDGLTQVFPKPFSLLSFDKIKFGNNIISITINQQNRWLGTEKGLILTDLINNSIIKFYGNGEGLPKDSVTALYFSPGKDLWIGTHRNGLYLMKGKKRLITHFAHGTGVLENSITTITGTGDQVWVGTLKGLLSINSVSGKIKEYSISQGGLPHNSINSLFIDRKGKLWVSTNSSILAYIQDEKVVKVPLNSSTGIFVNGEVTQDKNSGIWVGTKGSGIFVMQSDSVFSLTTKEGLISNYCYSLLYDHHNNIWVGHKGGLSRICTTDFMIKPLQQIAGLPGDFKINPNAAFEDNNEIIWFGSDKGLISYDRSKETAGTVPPVLGITSIKVNDDDIDFSDRKIKLSPGKYKIKIDFQGICLKEPSLVTYQYKLEGYDQWSDITKNNSVTYYHLTDGLYRFILKASSGDGAVTATPLSVSFFIEKPVWKKLWFYTLIVILISIVIFIYIKRREKKFIREKQILEVKVKERTSEIQQQKNEIELQRNEIYSKNANITSSINYARHIQNAVMPQAELIDKLFPESFIVNLPKDIVSGDFYWLTRKDKKIILSVADCTGHGVPGAFMSLLGITLLNEIVNIQGITGSDYIVTALRERVIQSLRQSKDNFTNADGMDISLCVLDRKNHKLQYTGAMNSIIFISDGKMEIIKADNIDVSITFSDFGEFKLKEFRYKKGDLLYLFTDGFPDQFGGEFNKKFSSRRFYNMLFDIHKLPMADQKEVLLKELSEWMNSTVQTDDITVMGIRL